MIHYDIELFFVKNRILNNISPIFHPLTPLKSFVVTIQANLLISDMRYKYLILSVIRYNIDNITSNEHVDRIPIAEGRIDPCTSVFIRG